jgi:hypothetical protein
MCSFCIYERVLNEEEEEEDEEEKGKSIKINNKFTCK